MYNKGELVGRVLSKVKREAYRRVPVLRMASGYEYWKALEAHSTKLPALDARDLPLLEGLRRDGAVVLDLESMGLEETPAMLESLRTLLPELQGKPTEGDNQPRLMPRRMMQFPEIYLPGLNDRLLRVVENYIGLPIRYHGVDVRREVADGRSNDVRQYHLDTEDHKMCRAIVYLNDVDQGGGPFEYIERENTLKAVRELGYGSGFVSDKDMQRVIPLPDWRQATGKTYTVAFADTSRVFHRARAPRDRDRYSITLTWTSKTPIKDYPAYRYTKFAMDYFAKNVSPRQLAALPDQALSIPVD